MVPRGPALLASEEERMDITLTARKQPLNHLVDMLRAQQDVRYDVLVPASRLHYRDRMLIVEGGGALVTDDGSLDQLDVALEPTDIFEDGVAEKLVIPRAYLRRMRETGAIAQPRNGAPEPLLDINVNAWHNALAEADDRRLLVRGFLGEPTESGIARALLSERYGAYDHLDIILAALDGAREAGLKPEDLQIDGDFSERNLRVRITAPGVAVDARHLIEHYVSPYSKRSGRDLPLVWAGLILGNSETGGGAVNLMPHAVFQVCDNGLTKKVDAVRSVHLGGKLEEGRVRWSDETRRAALGLVKAKARDAVATFLSMEYLTNLVEEIGEMHETPINAPIAEVIERVATAQAYTEAEANAILDAFIRGGVTTAGGVMQAVTAVAGATEDPDRAAALEDSAFDALALAASDG